MTTWILILFFNPGWQMAGTGQGGAALTSAVFNDKTACVAAAESMHKLDKSLAYGCFPSSSQNGGTK